MWKCTQSVILEDKFGVDHQFLKGHEYPSIEVNNTDQYVIEKGINWIKRTKKSSHFLTEEQRDQYFIHIREEYARSTSGNASLLSWGYKEQSNQ